MSANKLMENISFGSKLKELRASRSISQRELARRIGVTPAYLSDIERMRRNAPSRDILRKLAASLETPEEIMYDWVGYEPHRLPPDVPEIIKRHPETVGLLRSIQKNQLSGERVRELSKQCGGSDLKVIILAAGTGSRMKHLTQEMPKSMAIVFNGKTLLETQIETLRACGIQDISIVKGYKADKINFKNVRYFLNDNYANNNIMESLFYAQDALDGDVIVSYADIWYEADVVRRLMRSDKDIAIGVDIDWKEYYLGRKDHPIEEAENVIFDSNNRVIKIGKIAAEKEEVHGEFIGMIKLTGRGCEILKRHYHRVKTLFAGKPFQRAKIFEKAYLTDLLQDMADGGIPVHCEIIGSAWKEIDTVEDFEKAVAVFEGKSKLTKKTIRSGRE